MTRSTIQTDLGTEVLCCKCNEYWPRDPEFFFFSNGRPHSWCKACYLSDPKVQEPRDRSIQRVKNSREGKRGVAA